MLIFSQSGGGEDEGGGEQGLIDGIKKTGQIVYTQISVMALQARNEAPQLNSKILQGKDQGRPSSDSPLPIPARHGYAKAEELDGKLEAQMVD